MMTALDVWRESIKNSLPLFFCVSCTNRFLICNVKGMSDAIMSASAFRKAQKSRFSTYISMCTVKMQTKSSSRRSWGEKNKQTHQTFSYSLVRILCWSRKSFFYFSETGKCCLWHIWVIYASSVNVSRGETKGTCRKISGAFL
jgi:hypothetical protein